jgi:hypothetical protein
VNPNAFFGFSRSLPVDSIVPEPGELIPMYETGRVCFFWVRWSGVVSLTVCDLDFIGLVGGVEKHRSFSW